MAAFEVFVPVQGEFIVTVEADSEAEAIDLIIDGEVDFTDGEVNVEIDESVGSVVTATLIYGDAPDDDDERSGYTTVEESTGRVYAMRHFNIASLV